MTYRIEITADTLSELGGKLLALASQFHTTAADPVMPEVRDAAPKKASKPDPRKEVAEEPAGEPAPSAEAPSPQPTADEATAPASPATSPSDDLEFDRDVAPLVLALVAAKGKDAATAVLSQFGVERASHVGTDLWPELITALKDAAA